MTKLELTNFHPRITIITSTFNCAEALNKTAASIRGQSHKNIQWIIADGASTDGTVEAIKDNIDIVTNWFSESDNGIYDAWNKACRLIDGDWVLFLGAGDIFHHSTALSEFWHKAPEDSQRYSIIYGDVLIEKPSGASRYICSKPNLDFLEFGRPALPHHQGVFQKNNLFHASEPFDASYKIAADSKFLLQALKNGLALHVKVTIAKMSDDGASNDYKNIFVMQKEIKRLCKELNITIPMHHQIIANSKQLAYYIGHSILPQAVKLFLQKAIDQIRTIKKS